MRASRYKKIGGPANLFRREFFWKVSLSLSLALRFHAARKSTRWEYNNNKKANVRSSARLFS